MDPRVKFILSFVLMAAVFCAATPLSLAVAALFIVGFYAASRIPLLQAVRRIEEQLTAAGRPRGYLPIDGLATYTNATRELVFGKESPLLAAGRVATSQTIGGSGALRVGADLLHKLLPHATIAISNPSWENHRALFESAGFPVQTYRYYDAPTNDVNRGGMLEDLNALPSGSIVVLHACCHNPTGADLDTAQWQQVAALLKERQLFPFIDMAYQGFDKGIEQDGQAVRIVAEAGIDSFIVANSYSKSFSLYGERVGALSIVTQNKDESTRVLSQLKRVIRTNYSNPPIHGGAIVSAVLSTPTLRAEWEAELAGMRDRIRAMRTGLVDKLASRNIDQDFSFVIKQRGMFSYTGLTAAQVERMKDEFGIYAVSTGRICLAALNTKNLDYVADAIAAVIKA